jgi:dihydrofolate reductase
MGKMTCEFSMSLDGYVARPDDDPGPVFDWYGAGDVEFPTASRDLTFHVSEASAERMRASWGRIGCLISGGRLFRITDGWGGMHTVGAPVVVVSRSPEPAEWRARFPDAPFTFVGDVETAVAKAKEIAGDKDVAVAGPNIVQQVIDLGLMDEIVVSLVPVLIGAGVPFFGDLAAPELKLSEPEVVQGTGVTHLTFQVVR